MISLFRDKSIVAIFSLVVAALLTHLHIFFVPVHLVYGNNTGVLGWVFQNYFSKLLPSVINIIYILLLLLQSIRINIILNNNKMFNKSGFTAALALIILSGLFTNAFAFSPSLLMNSIIVLSFSSLIKLYNHSEPKALLFNMGFLTSICFILHQPSIFLVACILFGLAILRPFRATEWLVLLIGIIAPVYLLISGLFLFDKMDWLPKFIPQIKFGVVFVKETWHWITFGIIALLTLLGLLTWYPNSNRMVIQVRKCWGVLLLFAILSAVSVLFFSNNNFLPELLCMIPLAAFIANFLLYPQRTVFVNFILLLAAVVIVYNNSIIM